MGNLKKELTKMGVTDNVHRSRMLEFVKQEGKHLSDVDYEPGLRDGCMFSATLSAEGDETALSAFAAEHEAAKARRERDVWMNHNTLERGNPVKKFKGDL